MRKPLKDYFLPHDDNDHKPHMFRMEHVAALASVILLVFSAALLERQLINSNEDLLAAVLPGVLRTLANEGRTDNNLEPLEYSETLERAAQMKADHMAEHGYFAHTSPEGITPWEWFERVGYEYAYAGENLAVNFSDSGEVNDAWMDSPGHRRNILDDDFTEVGIATAEGEYKGEEAVYVVQLFGTLQTEGEYVAQIASVGKTDEHIQASEPVDEQSEPGEESESAAILGSETEGFAEEAGAETEVPEQQKSTSRQAVSAEKSSVMESGEEARLTFLGWLFLHPAAPLRVAYFVLSIAILISLGAMVNREAHRRHPLHVLAGMSLIILMIALVYAFPFV